MNLLLLSPSEFAAGLSEPGPVNAHEGVALARVCLTGRRAQHLTDVLRVVVGQQLRAGVVGFGYVDAQVVEIGQEGVGPKIQLLLSNASRIPEPERKTLLLAAPRPKVLSRCLEHAAALGFTEILLFRSYRVEKSHLLSHRSQSADHERHLLLGLEQARRVFIPRVDLFERFRPFVEDSLPNLLPTGPCFLAHPQATTRTSTLERFQGPYSLAIGPEGGFIPYEVQALVTAGFVSVSAGDAPLRVETALSYLTGQLDLLSGRL
ncbi:MAG: hypothetical protein RJA70_1662 [Pseudomonadota bacterium]|jgi:RsmE family RNA methyltransferase